MSSTVAYYASKAYKFQHIREVLPYDGYMRSFSLCGKVESRHTFDGWEGDPLDYLRAALGEPTGSWVWCPRCKQVAEKRLAVEDPR